MLIAGQEGNGAAARTGWRVSSEREPLFFFWLFTQWESQFFERD